ncbi:MAG: O-antigen ligase family protein [Chloroflexi bacterium]|nr:O-antigen ligase family protein [Chloroflexota bacterium]
MNPAVTRARAPLSDSVRQRGVVAIFATAAVAAGLAVTLSQPDDFAAFVVLVIFVAAGLTLPFTWTVLVVAALIPLQIYWTIPGYSFALRGAVVFVFAAAVRALAMWASRRQLTRWEPWMLPAACFGIAALAAAASAPSRYLALRGIYDWLVVFATALIAGEALHSRTSALRLTLVLVAAGFAEALLGLGQALLGLDRVLALLKQPIAQLFYQPSLLRDHLVDLSFNWVIFDRVSPFGTFINGIDYSIFLASILGLAVGILLARRGRSSLRRTPSDTSGQPNQSAAEERRDTDGAMRAGLLLVAVLVMGSALVLTFKGSGIIAFCASAATVALFGLRSISRRTVLIGLVCVAAAGLLALPFGGLLTERAVFLLQREQGLVGSAGRLEIWSGLLQSFAQRPVFGFGLNNAPLLTEPARTLSNGAITFGPSAAESSYVAALVETGVVGLGSLLALFFVVLKSAYRRALTDPLFVGVLAAFVALLVGNLTVTGFATDQNEMLLGMFIGMSCSKWKPR